MAEFEETHVKNIYETIANHFNATRQYKWDWVEKYKSRFDVDTTTIYDIGCGNGRNMDKNTIGVDNCESFLDICRNSGKNVMKGCMTNIPVGDKVAHGVQCIATFHHLSTIERRMKALKEMKRIMKDDGLMLISVWSKEQPKKTRRTFTYGDNYVPWNTTDGKKYLRFYYIFEMDEIKQLFKDAGLEIVEYEWSCGNEVFTLKKSM